ncbi:hypothetical protein KSS87_001361 [Heliosperma pusillum]|nr:hypothetical protein KSS87_001361 [Heliosperma pusillum]
MAAATTSASVYVASNHRLTVGSGSPSSLVLGNNMMGSPLREHSSIRSKVINNRDRQIRAVAAVETTLKEETKEYVHSSDYGQKLKIFYNPIAANLEPNEDYGIAFNGGFNQPIMCGGEPRAMLKKTRGKVDPPFYTIQICIPKHAMNLIFSFTNGTDWDGPYRLQFKLPRGLANKPITELNEGLAEELSREGACDQAIFPDTSIVVTRCAMIGNLTVEGGDRCNLDLVQGCIDPDSPMYNPLANVDDGSCPPYSDSEE